MELNNNYLNSEHKYICYKSNGIRGVRVNIASYKYTCENSPDDALIVWHIFIDAFIGCFFCETQLSITVIR